jgi:hypothetical protein
VGGLRRGGRGAVAAVELDISLLQIAFDLINVSDGLLHGIVLLVGAGVNCHSTCTLGQLPTRQVIVVVRIL